MSKKVIKLLNLIEQGTDFSMHGDEPMKALNIDEDTGLKGLVLRELLGAEKIEGGRGKLTSQVNWKSLDEMTNDLGTGDFPKNDLAFMARKRKE